MKIVWSLSLGSNIRLNRMREKFGKGTLPPMEYTVITNGADCYPWQEVFVIFPKKTITGKKLAWQKLYKRKVWVVWGTGFHMEPETQYATLFELLSHQD